MPTVDVDRDTAHDLAQQELNKSIYGRPSLSERLGDWFNELLFRIVEKGSQVPGGWFTIAVLVTLAALAAWLTIRVAHNTMRTNRSDDNALFGTSELSSAQHRATAEQYAAQGNWAAAIRHRLRAVARHLEESGTLDPVPGRTSYELARAAGAALPALHSELLSAATVFNDVTFGEQPGTPDGYRRICDLDEHLLGRGHADLVAATASTPQPWTDLQ